VSYRGARCGLTRRDFLAGAGAVAAAGVLGRGAWAGVEARTPRSFHVCLASKVVAEHPDLLGLVRDAGVTDVWQAAYFYGHWYEEVDALREARARVEGAGLRWHVINVPLGHPGDSLGDPDGGTPLTPPGRWRMAERPDGSRYSGTSLHAPATEENVAALRALAALEPDAVFLDDDFRLATGPGVIGGCYCGEHRDGFLRARGLEAGQWDALLEDVRGRRLTPVLRAWVDYTCDGLTASFRAQEAALPGGRVGNMVMYLGAEKAGIRLRDYSHTLFRVGELMFDDASFGRVKGKTDELFSVLFHRRYAQAALAFSETTAYPHDRLSAGNMAAKLAISTIADVRNTMFMSGLSPIPAGHWATLGPEMRAQAELHARVMGHRPVGPLKHYWGEAARMVGDDRPFSLFLAMGVPFEVIDAAPAAGVVFLCDQDAVHAEGLTGGGAQWMCRTGLGTTAPGLRAMEENLEALWVLKEEVLREWPEVPHVVENTPVVCAWYPEADGVVLWNLLETPVTIRVRRGAVERGVELRGLGSGFVEV